MRFTIVEPSEPPPEETWIRGPHPKGRCRYTGLPRTTLFELVERSRGKIKTVLLKKPGAIRGVRLIHLGSLQKYLSSLAEAQGKDVDKEEVVVPCET
jgi:hypothetical protein